MARVIVSYEDLPARAKLEVAVMTARNMSLGTTTVNHMMSVALHQHLEGWGWVEAGGGAVPSAVFDSEEIYTAYLLTRS